MNALQQTWLTKSISELRFRNLIGLSSVEVLNLDRKFPVLHTKSEKNQTIIDCIYFKSDSSGRFEAGSERLFFVKIFANTHDCSDHRIGGTFEENHDLVQPLMRKQNHQI